MEQNERIVRQPEVCARVGRSAPSLWRDIKSGNFPPPRKIGARSVGWLESELVEFLRNLPRA